MVLRPRDQRLDHARLGLGHIRFGAHRFDGPNKVLAHTFYPPPTNNNTAAGDLHLDYAEKWVSSAAAAIATPLRVASNGNSFSNKLIELV